jgi:hypothetical protein
MEVWLNWETLCPFVSEEAKTAFETMAEAVEVRLKVSLQVLAQLYNKHLSMQCSQQMAFSIAF